jgi:hypothetical protein
LFGLGFWPPLLGFLASFAPGRLRSAFPSISLPVCCCGVSLAGGSSFFGFIWLSFSICFGLALSRFGIPSFSLVSFSTHIYYIVIDEVQLSSRFSLISPLGGVHPSSPHPLSPSHLSSHTSLDYSPSDYLLMIFSMDYFPRYYSYPYSSFFLTR